VQTTLVNFCVTERGLEDQLLAQVVEHERPDLQEKAQALVRQLGEFTITLKSLEDNLLTRLANAQGDILEDIELIENLEETKRTAVCRSAFISSIEGTAMPPCSCTICSVVTPLLHVLLHLMAL
jgi:ATP-binding dynein motor region